ncbi:hypothetical protein ACI7MV_12445 [Pseudomonas sp. 2024-45]
MDSETVAAFLADAYDTGDAAYIAKAIAVVARAKIRIEGLEILQRVRQGHEAVPIAADAKKDLGLDD